MSLFATCSGRWGGSDVLSHALVGVGAYRLVIGHLENGDGVADFLALVTNVIGHGFGCFGDFDGRAQLVGEHDLGEFRLPCSLVEVCVAKSQALCRDEARQVLDERLTLFGVCVVRLVVVSDFLLALGESRLQCLDEFCGTHLYR